MSSNISAPINIPSSSTRTLPMDNSIKSGLLPVVQLTPGRKKTSLLTRSNVSGIGGNDTLDFEIKDYQGIVSKSALENELLHAGYTTLSKIVIQDNNGNRHTQYIKALNKKGQKVFILLDVNGYTTTRSNDIILIESNQAQIVPYSLKMGAVDCAGTEVCGIAFECGANSVCILSRDNENFSTKESNFVLISDKNNTSGFISDINTDRHNNSQFMPYPVIRLSEIRVNPTMILENSDLVTRRLRNASYKILLDDLKNFDKSINDLRTNFDLFMSTSDNDAKRLNSTINQLDGWNETYMKCPPTTDDVKERYRNLQFNLSQRNEYIEVLIRSMKKVADLRKEIDSVSQTISDVTDFFNKEFAYIDYNIPQ